LVPAPERRLPRLRLHPAQPPRPRLRAPAVHLPQPLEERLAHPRFWQPVAWREPPVVDRQAQRASRPPQPDGPRPRRGHPTARLRRRAGPRKTRVRALRREIPSRPYIPPLAPAGDQHATQQHRVPRREEGEEHAGRSPDDLCTLRAVLWSTVLHARTLDGGALRRRPSRALRHLHGLDLCPQPQSYAPPGTRQQGGLPAPTGANESQRHRSPYHRLLVRRPQLPDRTPPVPEVAPQQAARSAANHQRLLPGSLHRLPRNQRAPVLPGDPAASSRGRRTAARSKKGEVTVLQIRPT